MSPCDVATEVHMPRPCALQQEEPLQREAGAPHYEVAPARLS